jgi:hypothetical protein
MQGEHDFIDLSVDPYGDARISSHYKLFWGLSDIRRPVRQFTVRCILMMSDHGTHIDAPTI